MKLNPVRYSSIVGEAWMHFTFKVKYCHPIFDNKLVRQYTNNLFLEAFVLYGIRFKNIGFDSDHVHMILDVGIYSRPQVDKMLKGYTAKKLLKKYSWLKKEYFWGSGLWSKSSYSDSVGKDMNFMQGYVMKQKYALQDIIQLKINQFAWALVHATGETPVVLDRFLFLRQMTYFY